LEIINSFIMALPLRAPDNIGIPSEDDEKSSVHSSDGEDNFIAEEGNETDLTADFHAPFSSTKIYLNIEATYQRRWRGPEAFRELFQNL
jgi:hypothetical protein